MDNMKNTEPTIRGEDSLLASPPRSIVGTNYAERVEANRVDRSSPEVTIDGVAAPVVPPADRQ